MVQKVGELENQVGAHAPFLPYAYVFRHRGVQVKRRHAAEVTAAAATSIEAQNTGPQFAVDLGGVLEHVDAVAAIVGIGIHTGAVGRGLRYRETVVRGSSARVLGSQHSAIR